MAELASFTFNDDEDEDDFRGGDIHVWTTTGEVYRKSEKRYLKAIEAHITDGKHVIEISQNQMDLLAKAWTKLRGGFTEETQKGDDNEHA